MKIHHFDPVCGKHLEKKEAYISIRKSLDGERQLFLICCPECHTKFEQDEYFYMRQAQTLDENSIKLNKFLHKKKE